MKKYVLIISHGSREASANRDFKKFIQKYQSKHPHWVIAHAFLELVEPSIPQALQSMVPQAQEIWVLPLFLFAAKHVKKHIPQILQNFRQQHPEIKVKLGKPLGSEPKLLDILDQRLRQICPK